MKLDNCYYKEYIDLILIVIFTMFWLICPSVFFRCFMVNSEVHTDPRTEPFIWNTSMDCSNSVNHDWVQVLSYYRYSMLFLSVVGIEPATARWFHSEALSSQWIRHLVGKCHIRTLIRGILLFCRDAVGVFCSPNQLVQDIKIKTLTWIVK